MRYDAVIAGGSFAGLALASRLNGDVLLIDKKEIGSQTASACLTLLSVPEEMDCMDSVVQVYRTCYIHTPSKVIAYDLPYPFCTFDFNMFCQTLLRRLDTTVMKANVRGLQNGSVITDAGVFAGRCIVDASGWRAVLASTVEPGYVDRSKMSFGIEVTGSQRDEGLHFWVDPRLIKRGVGWLFPYGDHAGVGIGSYVGETKLSTKLKTFADGGQLFRDGTHGGYFPWRMRKPTMGGIFVVGDAAGQCLPLSGEGIRPGMYFGMRCAEIVQRVIDREIGLEEGLEQYENVVGAFGRYYMFLEMLQKGLLSLPSSWLTRFLVFLSKPTRVGYMLRQYEKRMNLSSLPVKSKASDRALSG